MTILRPMFARRAGGKKALETKLKRFTVQFEVSLIP